MNIKPYIILGVAVAVVLVGVLLGVSITKDAVVEPNIVVPDTARIDPSKNGEDPGNAVSEEGLNTVLFSGVLEAVDTGCFADGECFAVVDGKHVTAITGWSQETVGSIEGVEGFGNLEQYIGKQVEVYAQVKEDKTYTLYGSERFYIKVLDGFEGSPRKDDEENVGIGDEAKPQIVRDGCLVGGCSSQLCLDADTAQNTVTTCEYKPEYACYQVATCERQSGGECGWTMTAELTQCLSQNSGYSVESVQ